MSSWLTDWLATDFAFECLSILALISTVVVAIGLYFEYERHELRPFGRAKTARLSFNNFLGTKRLKAVSRKNVGSFLVVAGVVLEAFFGVGTFVSATIRESRLEAELIEVMPRPRLLRGENRRRLVTSLNIPQFKGQRVETRFCEISFSRQYIDVDTVDTAMLLPTIMQEAGWKADFADRKKGCNGTGIWIQVAPNASSHTRDAAAALAKAFKEVPLVADQTGDLTPDSLPSDANVVVVTVEAHPL